MAKIKYRIEFKGSGGGGVDPTAGIISAYLAGANGTPETRAYEIADPPPAFAPYPYEIGNAGNPVIDDGDYYVDYKDSGASNQRLAKISLIPFASSCWDDGAWINPTIQLIRFETSFKIITKVSPGTNGQASVNGGTVWKGLISEGGGNYSASWTQVELDALGFGDTIPDVKIRRDQVTNPKTVDGFSSSSVPGFPGPTYTVVSLVTDGSAGLVVGQILSFFGSTLGYNSAEIVNIPGPDAVVIHHPFNGDEAGVTAGILVDCQMTIAEDFFIGEPSFDPLSLSETHTNETSPDANDGTITITTSGGSGDLSFLWNDGSTSQNRINLQAGTYTLTVTDNVTLQEEEIEVTITEPAPEPIPVGTYLDVPKIQTLRFVREAVIDNCNTFESFDNTLFCKMEFFGVKIRPPFYQKVCKCDVFPIQIHSNFPTHSVELLSLITGTPVKVFDNVTLKQQLTGLSSTFDVYITDSGVEDPAGTSRVFFVSGTIPIPIDNGDVFDLTNNPDGYNGSYQVVGISNDILLGAPYLLINLTYDAGTPTSTGKATFLENVVDFDVYESILSFADVAEGLYYMRIRGINLDASFTEFVSEPINLKVKHPGTLLYEFRNFDNAAGVVYTTGITHRIRLEAKLQKPVTSSAEENYRESNGSPVKLTSRPQRKWKLEYFEQPFYRLELLRVSLGFDQVLINKVEYQSDEGASEPANRDFYLLANGSAVIEQKQWFEQYNGDDLGSVDPGYILTQFGYIQRT